MKNIFLIMSFCLIAIFPVQGDTNRAFCDFDVQAGYRHDTFNWNIGGLDGKPNILSELEWENLQSIETAANFRITMPKNLYLKGSASYGEILSGTCYDSDYFRNNRTSMFSKSEANARGGKVYDLSLAFGPQFNCYNNNLMFVPLIGYSLDVLNLKMRKGFQLFDLINDYYGPINGLNSSYHASFEGPFIGADVMYQATPKMMIFETIEYHVLNYKGKGDWNLREDLTGFSHLAKGCGISNSFAVFYQATNQFSFGLSTNYKAFKAKKGHCKTSVLLPTEKGEIIPLTLKHPFNAVKWNAYSVALSFKYSF